MFTLIKMLENNYQASNDKILTKESMKKQPASGVKLACVENVDLS